MKIGILVDLLDEHSGARAAPLLARALAKAAPGDEFVILTAQNRLSPQTQGSFPGNLKIVVFNNSSLLSLNLWRKIRGEKINLISAHCSLRLLIAARLSGRKIIRTDYGTQFPSLNNAFYSWRPGLFSSIINQIGNLWVYFRDYLKFIFSHRNIGISSDNALKARKLYGKKINFIYLGCDDFFSEGDSFSFSNGKNEDRLRILSVSRFVPYKGFHLLIESFGNLCRRYPKIELVLIGGQADSKYLRFIKNLAERQTNIKILFNPDDMVLRKYFTSSQIYASGTRWEAFGLPFLEASLFGLPTLGFSFFGPAAEVIKDGETGLLAKDFGDFQKNLEKLVTDEKLREGLGNAGRKFASHFTWQETAKGYLEIFKRTVL